MNGREKAGKQSGKKEHFDFDFDHRQRRARIYRAGGEAYLDARILHASGQGEAAARLVPDRDAAAVWTPPAFPIGGDDVAADDDATNDDNTDDNNCNGKDIDNSNDHTNEISNDKIRIK